MHGAPLCPAVRGATGYIVRRSARLTILVATRAKGCIVALSDRKESVDKSGANEVTKYYLSTSGGFYIALAGSGEMARRLLNELEHRQPSGSDVFKEIDTISARLFARQYTGQVAGHLIVAGRNEFELYTLSIVSGILVYAENHDTMSIEGDRDAVAICKDLARDMALSDMPCETAARCLHTMASRIAETVDSVGDHTTYGIDMVVFPGSGKITQLRRRTDKMGTIGATFEAHGPGPLLGPNGGE